MSIKTTKIFTEELSPQEKPYRIFVDMDGVLANFVKGFKTAVGEDLMPHDYEIKYGKEAFWSILDKKGDEFWFNLEWMPDGQELWNYVKKYNPTILSAPSKHESSKTGKLAWLKKNIPDLPNFNIQTKCKSGWDGNSKIILNGMKYRYAEGPKDILIDDTPKKIDAWISAGGTGILHKNTETTIQELKKLGL